MRTDSSIVSGESVFLRAPIEKDLDQWSGWFRDPEVTRFLPQGLFPSSVFSQRVWLEDEIRRGRFIAMVCSMLSGQLLGVVSISSIDHILRSGQVSTVVPGKDPGIYHQGLEARSLVTQFAFEELGLERLWAAQVFPGNGRWAAALNLIGWFPEGFQLGGWVKGNRRESLLILSTLRSEYDSLVARRDGKLWPGQSRVREELLSTGSGLEERLHDLRRSVAGLRQSLISEEESSKRA